MAMASARVRAAARRRQPRRRVNRLPTTQQYRRHALGFRAETEFREIIQTYIDDDLTAAQ